MAPRKSPATTTKKPAASKATGKHIPAPPTQLEASAAATGSTSTQPGAAIAAEPKPAYEFSQAGAGGVGAAGGPASAPAATPTSSGIPEGADDNADGHTWIDEQTALGRRLAVTRAAPDDDSAATYEELLPHGATADVVNAAKTRLRARLIPA